MNPHQSPTPRDRLGRPLRGSKCDTGAFPQVPERSSISGEQAWHEALEYLQQELPFHVHEVCEQRWRCAPQFERTTWRGLAQWGAALTHRARGNNTGAERLAVRARQTLDSADEIPGYIDMKLVQASIDELIR